MPTKPTSASRTKRPNRAGSIAWSEAHQRWEARLSLPDGRRTFTSTDRANGERIVTDALLDAQAVHRVGLPVTKRDLTVSRLLDEWLAAPRNIASSTLHNYTTICANYLRPTVGPILVADLTPAHVEAMLAALRAKGLGLAVQRKARQTLGAALKRAQLHEQVSRNVALVVEAPPEPERIGRALSPDAARVLLAYVPDTGDGVALTLALLLGLRRGEVLGLRWQDVDLDAGALRVNLSLHAADASHAELWLGEPKTKTSRRTVALSPAAVAVLRAHRARQAAERLAAPAWEDLDLVITGPNGSPRRLHALGETLAGAIARADADLAAGKRTGPAIGALRLHDLRHTAATLLLDAGIPLEQVSDTLGHAKISITADIYRHVDRTKANPATAAAMAALLG